MEISVYNDDGGAVVDVIACVDSSTTSPALQDHINECFSYSSDLFDDFKVGVHLVTVKVVDSKTYIHDYGVYEYDSELHIVDSAYICDASEVVDVR